MNVNHWPFWDNGLLSVKWQWGIHYKKTAKANNRSTDPHFETPNAATKWMQVSVFLTRKHSCRIRTTGLCYPYCFNSHQISAPLRVRMGKQVWIGPQWRPPGVTSRGSCAVRSHVQWGWAGDGARGDPHPVKGGATSYGAVAYAIWWSLLESYVCFTTTSLTTVDMHLLLKLCTNCHTKLLLLVESLDSVLLHCTVQSLNYTPVASIICWQLQEPDWASFLNLIRRFSLITCLRFMPMLFRTNSTQINPSQQYMISRYWPVLISQMYQMSTLSRGIFTMQMSGVEGVGAPAQM